MFVAALMMLTVNVLLLFAAGSLLRGENAIIRIFLGSLLGTVVTVLSLIPTFSFLGSFFGRLCILLLTGVTAFGVSVEALPKIILFSILHLSLGGAADRDVQVSMLLGSAGLGFACLIIGRRKNLIPVELSFGGQTLNLTALWDTGNSLRDPITGKSVLVVDADIAKKLTGLAPDALRDPVSNMVKHPGMRLIPYKTVGNTGFLLAMQIRDAKIGNHQGSAIVAFSPCILGTRYQALTGGTL